MPNEKMIAKRLPGRAKKLPSPGVDNPLKTSRI
jgi:hypothetical protein